MFEIHYHLLYGVDDGPKDIEGSLALAEASIAEGVTHIVCTPHANSRYAFRPEVNRQLVETLNERLGGRLTLGLGCDFHLSTENIANLFKDPWRYTINGKRYLLVEFPDFGISPDMTATFQKMMAAGVTPILTHPERNPTLQKRPGWMREWMELGCFVQITAASFLGRFGREAESMALHLLRHDWVHIVASDAHSVENRPPSLSSARALIESQCGQETAERICVQNPRLIFFGEPLPPQPEPIPLEDKPKPGGEGTFRKLWNRLTG